MKIAVVIMYPDLFCQFLKLPAGTELVRVRFEPQLDYRHARVEITVSHPDLKDVPLAEGIPEATLDYTTRDCGQIVECEGGFKQ